MTEEAPWLHQQQGTSNPQIAIVDDDATLRASLARLLEACSYRARTYGSAREFLNSDDGQLPDCMIVDQNMDEMTGEELLLHLAQSGTRIPAIVLTGHDTPGTRERFQQAGAVIFLVKPVTPDQLLMAIEAAISTKLLH